MTPLPKSCRRNYRIGQTGSRPRDALGGEKEQVHALLSSLTGVSKFSEMAMMAEGPQVEARWMFGSELSAER